MFDIISPEDGQKEKRELETLIISFSLMSDGR